MQQPIRTTTTWLAQKLLLLLAIIAALVVWDAYRDQSILFGARLKGLAPDKALIERFEKGQDALVNMEKAARNDVNKRIFELRTADALQSRIDELPGLIRDLEAKRRTSVQRSVALVTGEGFVKDLELEIQIELAGAELEVLKQMKGDLEIGLAKIRDARRNFPEARARMLRTWADYLDQKATLQQYKAAQEYYLKARAALQGTIGDEKIKALAVQAAGETVLEPVDRLIKTKQQALQAAEAQIDKLKSSLKKVFWKGVAITLGLILAPVLIKVFWYFFVARFAETRRPIRLTYSPRGEAGLQGSPQGELEHQKISEVSKRVVLNAGEELLVHPNFLQSSSDVGQKDTKWILSWHFRLSSLAAGMVGLTRIRVSKPEMFVISSMDDPLSEVAVVQIDEEAPLVLQPRYLVGLIQREDQPLRISRKWNWSLHSWITLQFRYMIFEGPGKLVVQGCRGVRLESADNGRSVDQRSTMGFSAHLAYRSKRSETFGAYLMGLRGLFNDSFTGGPGFYLCEELPYRGKRTGVTGRGLEGLIDGLMKVVGI